mgnify:CR=1 FL=1
MGDNTEVMSNKSVALALMLAAMAAPPASTRFDDTKHVTCEGRPYEYTLFAPKSKAPPAAIMLLPAPGGRGASMVSI